MEDKQHFLLLPEDVVGIIFSMLDLGEEIRDHQCIAKSWNERYWASIKKIWLPSTSYFSDARLIYVLNRVNPFRLQSLDIAAPGSELTLNSLSLVSRLTNLNHLRVNGWQPELIKQIVPSLVSLRSLHIRSKMIDDDCMNMLANNLSKLTRIICSTSLQLHRWRDVSKLTKLKEVTIASTPLFSSEGYADLATASTVTYLNVNSFNPFNEESLRHILGMTNLQSLAYFRANVQNPSVFSGLLKMTKLRSLHGGIPNDEEILSYLCQVSSLTSLRFTALDQGKAELFSAKFLSQLTALKELSGTTVYDTGHMAVLTNLENFSAYQQTIDEKFPLQMLTRLSTLVVKDMDSNTLQKISHLVNLQSLWFENLTNPQENDFEGIERCQFLQSLTYWNRPLSNKQFGWIAQCTNLKELRVSASPECAKDYAKLLQLTALDIYHPVWSLKDALKLTTLTQLKLLSFSASCRLMERKDKKEIFFAFSPDCRPKLRVEIFKKN